MTAIASAVRERPIIFSGEMVRAILDGRKTQTRRVVVPQPPRVVSGWFPLGDVFKPILTLPPWDGVLGSASHKAALAEFDAFDNECIRCPFGQRGDRLWVREEWSAPDGCECVETCHIPAHVYYTADASGYEGARHNRIRSPIHMPRWASRLTLEVTGVRIERVQDITYSDVLAEGCPVESVGASPDDHAWYQQAWDALNAKRGYGWDVNPWVWVVAFKRVTL